MEERFGDTAKDEKLLQEGSVQELRPPSVCIVYCGDCSFRRRQLGTARL